jgi:hypothetical protein
MEMPSGDRGRRSSYRARCRPAKGSRKSPNVAAPRGGRSPGIRPSCSCESVPRWALGSREARASRHPKLMFHVERTPRRLARSFREGGAVAKSERPGPPADVSRGTRMGGTLAKSFREGGHGRSAEVRREVQVSSSAGRQFTWSPHGAASGQPARRRQRERQALRGHSERQLPRPVPARHGRLSIVRGGPARRAARGFPRGGAPDSAVSERVRGLLGVLRPRSALRTSGGDRPPTTPLAAGTSRSSTSGSSTGRSVPTAP